MYTLTLSHRPNPDITGGYWTLPPETGAARLIEVETIHEASRLSQRYIESNALGGGNWSGGQIHDEAGELVGRIAYNGRYFDAVAA